MKNVTAELGKHLAELVGLPFERMRKITVVVEARSVPVVEVEYHVMGERATNLESMADEGSSPVETRRYRIEPLETEPSQ